MATCALTFERSTVLIKAYPCEKDLKRRDASIVTNVIYKVHLSETPCSFHRSNVTFNDILIETRIFVFTF